MKKLLISMVASLALTVGTSLTATARTNNHAPVSLDKIPNKTALAKWPKQKTHQTAAQVAATPSRVAKPLGRFAKAEAKGQTFRCALLYSDNWDEDEEMYGAYSFNSTDVNNFTRLYLNTEAPANGGGFFTEDRFYFTSYVIDDWGWDYTVTTYAVDTETWEVVSSVEQGTTYALATDLAYDPIEKKAFGSFYSGDDDTTNWGYLDPETLDYTIIAEVDYSLSAVAANNQGEIYGITSEGKLIKIDKYSGAYTLIGNTNATPYYYQSAAFDENGTLYWAAGFSDGSTGLFTVDTETASISLIQAFDNEEEVVALYAVPAEAADGAPGEPTDLALNFVDDQLTGTISFAIPAIDNNGEELTGDVNYIITVDSDDVANGTAAAGTTATVEVGVASAGVHTFSVRLSNDKGESKRVNISQWIGIDRPVAVSDLQMTKTGELQATITWTAPTKGALDGFFDASRLSYTVTRLPEGKVVATGLTETSFVDDIDYDGKVYLTYKVTPYADDVEGAAAVSNGAVFGHALTVPASFTFATEADYNIFTIIDNNETANLDSGMWQYSPSGQCAGYVSGTKDGDDWLMTPEITLQADRQYTFSFETCCYSNYWPDSFEVYMGSDATIEAMTTQLVAPTTIYWEDMRKTTLTVTVPTDGNYVFGFHALSEAGGAFFIVDNVEIEEGYLLKAPAKVENLVVTPGAKGAAEATVSFNAPTKAVDESDLTELTKVKVYRDEELVKTFESPQVGESLTFLDTDIAEGEALYKVVATNSVGTGVESTLTVWVGNDTPGLPLNLRSSVVDGHPVLTWEAPSEVGANGGYVDVESVKYYVLRINDYETVAEAISELTFTDEDTDITNEGKQKAWHYAVYAAIDNNVGEGNQAYVITGKKYDLPFSESFADGTTSQLWLISGESGDKWVIADDWSATPQDNDGGLLLITSSTPGTESTAVSGKINLENSKNASLSFYLEAMTYENDYPETDAADDYLEVKVAGPDYEFKTIETIRPSELEHGEFIKYDLPLTDYDGTDYILVSFTLHSVAAQTPLALDNIKVTNNYDANLAVTAFSAPSQVNITEDFDLSVTVNNDAVNAATAFDVNIYRGDELVASKSETEALAAGESRDYPFTLTALSTWGDKETFTAVVVIEGDENSADDEAEVSVEFARPEMPAVNDLQGEVNADGTAVLTWSEPVIAAYTDFTEDFESYANGKASSIGDWTLSDQDGVYGVDDITVDGEYIDIPHPFARQSFQVVNPESMGIDIESSPQWAAHSGNKMIVSFRNWDNDNDDWLISPRLSGQAQTVTFWARSPKNDKDVMMVYYSKEDSDVDSFIRFEEGRISLTNEWTEYSFTVSEGTNYFAIRNKQTGGEAIMLDDFAFQVGASWAVEPVVEGYNLYKDGELINESLITETSYTVNSDVDGTYTVTVVYNVGESEASNAVQIEASGVENVTIDNGADSQAIYDLYGRRVVNPQPGKVYVRRGEKFIYRPF